MIERERAKDGGAVQVITIARPDRANALDAEHWAELAVAFNNANAEGARAIVLTGRGRSFCAGGDLREPDYDRLLKACDECMTAITDSPAPVIVHVNGPAIGAGLQLAITCDLRVADPSAWFAIPAAAISRPVQPAVIRRMAALAGVGGAAAMLLGGDSLSAERAHQLGLVNRLGDLDAAVDWACGIAGYAPLPLRFFKQELLGADVDDQARYREFLARLLASRDFAEAGRASAEKRPPVFEGR
jgi:enoyl-CoA hydratase